MRPYWACWAPCSAAERSRRQRRRLEFAVEKLSHLARCLHGRCGLPKTRTDPGQCRSIARAGGTCLATAFASLGRGVCASDEHNWFNLAVASSSGDHVDDASRGEARQARADCRRLLRWLSHTSSRVRAACCSSHDVKSTRRTLRRILPQQFSPSANRACERSMSGAENGLIYWARFNVPPNTW